jgi:major membrane immunogen (membrane-anchored lipoprotein)
MKTINKFGLILLTSISVLLSSCSKSDSGGSSIPETGSYIQANVAGSNFQSSGDFFSGTFSSSSMNISGTSTDGKSLNIQLYPLSGTTLTTGTYNINSTSQNGGGYCRFPRLLFAKGMCHRLKKIYI